MLSPGHVVPRPRSARLPRPVPGSGDALRPDRRAGAHDRPRRRSHGGASGRSWSRSCSSADIGSGGSPDRLDYAREGEPRADWYEADLRQPETLVEAVRGSDAIVFVAGSKSWADPSNTPELVDYGGVAALADLGVEHGVQQFVLLSSAAVTQDQSRMSEHLRNVLRWKYASEQHLRRSGLDYTILRPLGMWDRPARELGICLAQGDRITARVTISRADLARVCVHCVFDPSARRKTFELFNAAAFEVDGWKEDLKRLERDPAAEPR